MYGRIFQKGIYILFVFQTKARVIENVADFNSSLIVLKAEVHNLDEQIENITNHLKEEKTGDRPVLFFVELSQALTLDRNSIIEYDKAILNEGHCFDTGDGIFIAPISGVYQFTWTSTTYDGCHVETELRVENAVRGKMHVSLGSEGHISGTKMALCNVKREDHVWIQTSRHYSENRFDFGNSFTGMLMHKYKKRNVAF